MEKVSAFVRKYWKIYLVAAILCAVCDYVGTLRINTPIGTFTFFSLLFTTILASLLGQDILKVFTVEESETAGALVLVILAPFMAKMGVSAGANLSKLVAVSPALILQEFGNLGTIFLSLPLALLLGLKRESIGACYSINRDSNLGLTTDIYGPDAPETKGTFSVYVVGSIIGTVFISLLANFIIQLDVFHPLALGMASGVGSGAMMSAASATVAEAYPEFGEQVLLMGSMSDMLTGATGIYMGTFISLPLTTKLYQWLSPRIGKHAKKEGS